MVGIDEAQFFDDEIVDVALELADDGARVIAAGLDQDFRRLPFGPMPELLAHAEFVDKLQAVCHRCGGGATTTQRLVDGRPAPYSGATIVVGANEQYEARCRDCHEAGQTIVARCRGLDGLVQLQVVLELSGHGEGSVRFLRLVLDLDPGVPERDVVERQETGGLARHRSGTS